MMKTLLRKIMLILCAVHLGIFAIAETALSDQSEGGQPDGLLSRIDFGNAYVMGQTIKSGAIYLMQRKQSDINSMLKYREHYRDEILDQFVGKNGEVAESQDSKKK